MCTTPLDRRERLQDHIPTGGICQTRCFHLPRKVGARHRHGPSLTWSAQGATIRRRMFRAAEVPMRVSNSRGGRDTVDIALVVPRSGPAGLFGPSCEACAALAVEDINRAGGILDRP